MERPNGPDINEDELLRRQIDEVILDYVVYQATGALLRERRVLLAASAPMEPDTEAANLVLNMVECMRTTHSRPNHYHQG